MKKVRHKVSPEWKESLPKEDSHTRVILLKDPRGNKNFFITTFFSGQELLLSSTCHYQKLQKFFTKQVNSTTCCIVTTTIMWNTLFEKQRYEESRFFADLGGITKGLLNEKLVMVCTGHARPSLFHSFTLRPSSLVPSPLTKLKMNGMTLDDCENLNNRIAAFVEDEIKVNIKVMFAQDSDEAGFVADIKTALADAHSVMCINYQPSVLIGKEFSGHFSPVAAYHEDTRMVLILDVWPDTPEMWVPVDDLWLTVNTKDWDSKVSRGWMILQRNHNL